MTEQERNEIFEALWQEGGFKFMWGSFNDLIERPPSVSLSPSDPTAPIIFAIGSANGALSSNFPIFNCLSCACACSQPCGASSVRVRVH